MDVIEYPVIGLDISKNRIGFASLDGANAAPFPLFTMEKTTRKRDILECVNYLQRFKAKTIVIGLPLERDGTFGASATWVRRMARDIKNNIDLPVYLVDERYTTVLAKEYAVNEPNGDIDALAAFHILKHFVEIKDKNDEDIIIV